MKHLLSLLAAWLMISPALRAADATAAPASATGRRRG
jgi:hypothetical protein